MSLGRWVIRRIMMNRLKAAIAQGMANGSEKTAAIAAVVIGLLHFYGPADQAMSWLSGWLHLEPLQIVGGLLGYVTLRIDSKRRKIALPAAAATVAKLVVAGLLISAGLAGTCQAATIDALIGVSGQGPGTSMLYGIGLDVPAGDFTLAGRLSYFDRDAGSYATGLQLTGEYPFETKGPFDPYVTAGAGLVWTQNEETVTVTGGGKPAHCWHDCPATPLKVHLSGADESHLQLLGGAGANIHISKAWGVQVEALYAVPLHSDAGSGLVGTLGVSYLLP